MVKNKQSASFTEQNPFWLNAAPGSVIKDDQVIITTAPGTDLWQRTYYGFRRDNAPMLLTKCAESYFSFTVKTSFEQSTARFDQCGIIVYLDAENWLKASVEYENAEFAHLGSVVTNGGFSDWATVEIGAEVQSMWYRLSRRQQDFCVECSDDGMRWHQMRVCHLAAARDTISFGIYACSPENSSFTAGFTRMAITPCVWTAHH